MRKALIETISPENADDALDSFFSEMSATVDAVNAFSQNVLFLVIDKFIGNEVMRSAAREIDIGAVPRSADIEIPFSIEVSAPFTGDIA